MTPKSPAGFKIKVALGCALFVLAGFIADFITFADKLPQNQPTNIVQADAIVVLTGGRSRISDALKLLSMGKGRRLLISGVHVSTSRAALAKIAPSQSTLLKCCVDLDKAALNTIGNAIETAAWATKHNFKSLIVVTSSYHMPRSLAELQHALPSATLIAYPVLVKTVPLKRWWTNYGTTRLLGIEYVKYLMTLVRLKFAA